MLWGKLVAECYFWAWMALHPAHLVKLLIRLVVMASMILAPLIAMHWHLAERGI